VVPYLDLLISKGLRERVDGMIARYKTTAKGEAALGHMRELEKIMPEKDGRNEVKQDDFPA
jgi:predicted transcriptional regulator